MNKVIIISYSYPPDNSPAAHRPFELASYLEKNNIPFIVYSKYGNFEESSPLFSIDDNDKVNPKKSQKNGHSLALKIIKRFNWLIEIDKALPWGLKTLPKVLIKTLVIRFKDNKTPIIWATSPGITNSYIGMLVSYLSFSKLHIDIRDAAIGVSSNDTMPLMTRLAYKRAKTITSVTYTLGEMIENHIKLKPKVVTVFNGTSLESINTVDNHTPPKKAINLSYAGALYGGDRPVVELVELLNNTAEYFDKQKIEVHLNIISREDLSQLASRKKNKNLHLNIQDSKPKKEALEFSANSDINIVLIGSKPMHKCGIPLKIFDLLGIGRPILLMGPKSSDAVKLLEDTKNFTWLNIDTETENIIAKNDSNTINKWISMAQNNKTNKNSDHLASDSSAKIYSIISAN